MKKVLSILLSVLLMSAVLTGCGQQGAKNSAEATPENPMILALAHNMNEKHSVHIALKQFADRVAEKSNGRLKIKIYPNAQLGSETEVIEQLMAGVLAMTKVSAPGLATYNDGYNTFGLPYVFDSQEQFYKVMDSPQMRKFFLSSENDGFISLTYYTSGSRSFYTVDKPIRTPEDLKGLKIRVQDMKTQTDMMKALGGTPVTMSYGDVYTALQTGVIDGAESNETALTTGKHGEVCKVFSYDEHSMIPDVLIMSSKVWQQLSPEDQQILIEAAAESTQAHKAAWDKSIKDAVTEAKSAMHVEFVQDVDKKAFQDATKQMNEDYAAKYPKVRELLDAIHSVQ